MHSVSAFLLLYVLFYCLHAINYFLTFIIFCDFPILYFPLYTISFCEWLSNTNVTCHANQASWNWKNKLGVQCDGDTSQLHDVIFMKWDKFKRAETGMRDWQTDQNRLHFVIIHSVCATKELFHCYVNQNETFMSKPSSHSRPTGIVHEWPIWSVGCYLKLICSKR